MSLPSKSDSSPWTYCCALVRCSVDRNVATNGCKKDSSRGSTPLSKLGRTSASLNNSSNRIRKRRSIDGSPFHGFTPLKEAYTTNTYGESSPRHSRTNVFLNWQLRLFQFNLCKNFRRA